MDLSLVFVASISAGYPYQHLVGNTQTKFTYRTVCTETFVGLCAQLIEQFILSLVDHKLPSISSPLKGIQRIYSNKSFKVETTKQVLFIKSLAACWS